MTDFATRRRIMVDTQVRPSDVTKFPIIDAMLSVPREDFVPDSQREAAYVEDVIDLGNGRSLLEPRTLAKMLDALNICNDEVVLDIAPALGYSTAVAARMAELVVAVESDEALASEAQNALTEVAADNAVVHVGPLEQGAEEHGPYDADHDPGRGATSAGRSVGSIERQWPHRLLVCRGWLGCCSYRAQDGWACQLA